MGEGALGLRKRRLAINKWLLGGDKQVRLSVIHYSDFYK